jgi:hypothetical protein
MAISDFFVEYWFMIFGGIGGALWVLLLDLEAIGQDADRDGPHVPEGCPSSAR